VFFVVFAGAVVALREVFRAYGEALAAQTAVAWLAALGWTALLLGGFLYAGFLIYATDREAGKLRRRVGLYERFMSRGS
jgi:hypothetical protein